MVGNVFAHGSEATFLHQQGGTEQVKDHVEDHVEDHTVLLPLFGISPYIFTQCFMVAWGKWDLGGRKIDKILIEKQILMDKTFPVIFILKTCFCLVWNIFQSNIKQLFEWEELWSNHPLLNVCGDDTSID